MAGVTHGNHSTGADSELLNDFNNLDQGNTVVATYIWLDANQAPRQKSRTLPKEKANLADLPVWNYDGSSTGQAPGDKSDVLIVPRAIFRDPFRRGDNILVLTDTYDKDMNPLPTNTRYHCNEIMEKCKGLQPWFGIEQEYSLMDLEDHWPIGWPKGGYPAPQGEYYCGVGAGKVVGRDIVEAHLKACIFAGVQIAGTNAEVKLSQWEYQVGPCEGIKMGDHLTMARFLMLQIAERFGVVVTLDPKPISGDWNGAGCHTNYSTLPMRLPGGMKHIEDACKALEPVHKLHISKYGAGNERRLTGLHETASMESFSWGVSNRGASIRIPLGVARDGYGYLEDRRPASNIDPYIVTALLCESTIVKPGLV